MQAVVETPHISLNIKGKLSPFMVEALKKEYGKKLILKDDEQENSDYFSTPLAKALDAEMTPGMYLKIYRENHGLTQEQLGKKVGVSKNYISDWENGRRNISKEKAKALSVIFNFSAEHFI